MVRLALLPALALLTAALVCGQGVPVTLQRLSDALESKTLSDKDIAEIVLEVGVSFRLTGDIERDLRRRGASDLVILAVRNGFRPPLPVGPATLEAIGGALERKASSADIVDHVQRHGVAGPFDPALRDGLESAGASATLQRIVAARWLEANALDGSLEQMEALLAAGATSEEVAAKVGSAPLAFAAGREAFSRLSAAGAGPELLRAVASSFLEDVQEPLSLDQIVAMQGAGVETAALAKRIGEVGTDFEREANAAESLRAAGVDSVIAEAVLSRRIGAAQGPLTLEALAQAARSGVPDRDLVEAMERRGVDFALTSDAAASLTSFSRPVRLAAVLKALGQQGYRAFRLPRSASYDDKAVQGSMDIRLTIDHVEDVVALDDVILIKNLRGSPAVDQGSELSQSLPLDLDPNTFAVELKDGRGQMAAYWMPQKSNGFILRARIFDEKGGADRYHMRLSWRRGGANAGGERRESPSLLKK